MTSTEFESILEAAEYRKVEDPEGVIAFVVWPGNADLVVLAHATGFHKEMWAPVVGSLREAGVGATIAALDLRGHGDSSEPAHEPSAWDFARDVARVVAQVTSDRGGTGYSVGVGHSLGGMAVTAATMLEPGVLDSLVLMDPALILPEQMETLVAKGDNPWANGARRRKAAFPSRDEAYQSYSNKPVFNTWAEGVLGLYVDHGFDSRNGEWTLKCRPSWEAATFSLADFPTVWEQIGTLDVPITLITGDNSVTHPLSIASALAGHLSAHHERLHNVSHFIPMDAPQAVAVQIAKALAEGTR